MVFITGLGVALAAFFVVRLLRRYCVRFSVSYFIVPEWRKLVRREQKLADKAAVRALGWRNWIPMLAVPPAVALFWLNPPYGLLIVSLAAVLLAPLFTTVIHRHALRRECWAILASRGKSICTDCGYNLTGNVSGRCPECGKETLPISNA